MCFSVLYLSVRFSATINLSEDGDEEENLHNSGGVGESKSGKESSPPSQLSPGAGRKSHRNEFRPKSAMIAEEEENEEEDD